MEFTDNQRERPVMQSLEDFFIISLGKLLLSEIMRVY